MSHLRTLTWTLGVAVLLAPVGAARADEPAQTREGQFSRMELPVFSILERMNHLLVPGAQGKLNLTAQQLDQITKLQYDFRAQRRDMLIKLADNLATKCREKDEDGVTRFDACQGALTVFTGLLRIRGVRDQFESKARDLLTADQKKQYAQLEDEWLRRISERRMERMHARHSGEFRVFDTQCQEHMKLTAEQRQKLGELFKDMDSKLKTILTNEQYQELQPRRLRQTKHEEQLNAPANSEPSK